MWGRSALSTELKSMIIHPLDKAQQPIGIRVDGAKGYSLVGCYGGMLEGGLSGQH